jgi:hypothetical protein
MSQQSSFVMWMTVRVGIHAEDCISKEKEVGCGGRLAQGVIRSRGCHDVCELDGAADADDSQFAHFGALFLSHVRPAMGYVLGSVAETVAERHSCGGVFVDDGRCGLRIPGFHTEYAKINEFLAGTREADKFGLQPVKEFCWNAMRPRRC